MPPAEDAGAAAVASPPCKILFRTKGALEIHNVPSRGASGGITVLNGPSVLHALSPDGSRALVLKAGVGVVAVDLESPSEDGAAGGDPALFLKGSQGVRSLCYSSGGSYVVTWERPPPKGEGGGGDGGPPNLKIWSASTGEYLYGFAWRLFKRDAWPPVRWTHDDKWAFRLAVNEVHVYPGDGFEKGRDGGGGEVRYVGKVRCQGIASFSLPPSVGGPGTAASDGSYLMSAFVPETKGKPARISLLRYPSGADAVCSKSFYRAEECSVRWSPRGDACLALVSQAVDGSGQSYYGSSDSYLLRADLGKGSGEAISIPLPSGSGPVADAQWMPNAAKPPCFVLISGKMPATASLHRGDTGDATSLLGNAHRNTACWSPHGRFLCMGGFGNLAGGMDFWDYNKKKTMPQYDPASGADTGARGNTASCAVGYGWSPCGRYFMVSTTSPRMNVDNGVRLFKYNGVELTEDKGVAGWDNAKYAPDRLLEAEFLPAPSTVEYPDRPQTPPQKREGGAGASEDAGRGGSAATAKPAAAPGAYVPPRGRYVPPGARGGGGGGTSLADRMRRE
eukprot:CAMPEP_0183295674 /NCGR_PEP_ID=MMETSP0160_2-20130417/3541_1 /TAXON_ID=2839 ORGANISM="Odontella Sinensis, Strain Grunow 1884" /NCGR_SAMPLE_ID=MMETSP0160_2 /ASSEMBLY_ACC=CAM_ASM_000250 /LENGTH=562 /DNA_ID=CAMNT_0025457193 /DNA_START=38 /DNA_END=1723 /DNA_ORIENTATION=+